MATSGSVSAGPSQKRKRQYDVVLEPVTQKKKKLQVTQTSSRRPPVGHIFIPAGLSQLTIRCKDVCRLRGLPIEIVSISCDGSAKSIGSHLQRLGYHFPSPVVETACLREGYVVRNGKLEQVSSGSSRSGNPRSNQSLDGLGRTYSSDQIVKGIKDLFPCIPPSEAQAVTAHAFRAGTNRVGNALQHPFARRIQLAVSAYIRHQHTPYDTLLRTHMRSTAREMVERACIQMLLKWQGEDQSQTEETEDIFREIIVLDGSDSDRDDYNSAIILLSDGSGENKESLEEQSCRWGEETDIGVEEGRGSSEERHLFSRDEEPLLDLDNLHFSDIDDLDNGLGDGDEDDDYDEVLGVIPKRFKFD